MNDLPYLFPVFFVGFFVLIMFILSKRGWADLVDKYRMENSFQGHSIGIISARINRVKYSNSLILKYNQDGFYLRPIFIFRLFHKPIFIPWKEVKDVRAKKIFFQKLTEMVIGEPAIAIMQIRGTTFSEVARTMNLNGIYDRK